MSDCLVIMHVREIPPVMAAYEALPYEKLWLTGYTERQLADGVFMDALRQAGHDRYLVCSDDILVRRWPVEFVRTALNTHPVATGYSQRSHTDMTVNVTKAPLSDTVPHASAYEFAQLADVVSYPNPLLRSWFAGMSITGMSMEMWERFPFGCFGGPDEPGYASDFHLSRRLQDEDIPIAVVRDAFAYHWRNEWRSVNHPDDADLFIGQRKAEVVLEKVKPEILLPELVRA